MRVALFKGAAVAAFSILALSACGNAGTGSQTQVAAVAGKAVNISGCARPATNASTGAVCVAVRGPGGVMYDVTSASPAPDPSKGVSVAVTGMDNGQASDCGKVLTDVKWEYLSLRCSASAPTTVAAATETTAP
ncbi:hypothetical protein [Caulobacter sp. NIBR2454]|uniref:hypothetical protein n=1 Tax=Caulobacter sp. NIBR2454 TaxID=3015996 RepID=UPI0022B7378D|nr:hypothetical protein [Caulobacter sp. NIBR2454]